MSYRVRLKITWSVAYGAKGTPFSTDEDFYAYARSQLADRFANYGAELAITKTQDFHGQMAEYEVLWDVTLDGVPGAWHQPEDHARMAEVALREHIRGFAHRVKIEVLRFPVENDPDGATDLVAWDADFPKRDFKAAIARLDAEAAAA